MNMSQIVTQLKKERDVVTRQLAGLNAAITAFTGVYTDRQSRKGRTMSAKVRAKIAAAQRARWARIKAKKRR